MTIRALTLTDAELAKLEELTTPEEFDAWMVSALAGFIEMKTELRAQEQARALITGAVDAAKADFPSVFSEPTVLEA